MESQMKKNQEKDPEEEERKRRLKLRGELKEEEEVEEVWDPESIRTLFPYVDSETGNTMFVVTSEKDFGTFFYVGCFEEERPVRLINCPKDVLVTYMNMH
jgi:hypothetical protein